MKKKTLSQNKKLLWNEVKRITRKRYKHCYTCPKLNLEGANAQSGHGKAKGALPLKFQYDLRNIRLQCFLDNIHRGGASDIFISNLEREKEGRAFLKEACVKINGHWEIKHHGVPLMGSIEAYVFVSNLLEEYRKL